MKFLHASDLLIGLSFPRVPTMAERLRSARLETTQNLLTRAAREKVDAVVLSGNTLADNRILDRDLNELARILGRSAVDVFLLPGTTDPFTRDCPYRREGNPFRGPVRILHERQPLRVGDATLYPCPVTARVTPTEALFSWIPPRSAGDGIRIGIACTEAEQESWDAQDADLDYVMLGGRRTASSFERGAWSGSAEATNFGEGRGSVHVVALEPSQSPLVQTARVGKFMWTEMRERVRSVGRLREDLEGLSKPVEQVVRLVLQGTLTIDDLEAVDTLLGDFRKQFAHLEAINRIGVEPRQHELYRNAILRSMVERLGQAAETPTDAEPDDLAEPWEIARQALLTLHRTIDASDQDGLI